MSVFTECLLQAFAAFAATLAFCVLFNVPFRQYAFCGANGAVSWVIYYFSVKPFGAFAATFAATVAIVLISRISAIYRKTPVTVLLIPGMIPLVPGAAIYHTAYYCFTGDVSAFAEYGFMTVKIAFAIVLGIVVVFALPLKRHNFAKRSDISKGGDRNG